jgi:hypothetical protein
MLRLLLDRVQDKLGETALGKMSLNRIFFLEKKMSPKIQRVVEFSFSHFFCHQFTSEILVILSCSQHELLVRPRGPHCLAARQDSPVALLKYRNDPVGSSS